MGTIAVATSAVPAVANAKKAAEEATVAAPAAFGVAKQVAFFAAGGVVGLVGKSLLKEKAAEKCVDKIDAVFPGALKNKDLVSKVDKALSRYGYGSDSLVATSLCADEVNRVLEKDFSAVYDDNFHMGGLAGAC